MGTAIEAFRRFGGLFFTGKYTPDEQQTVYKCKLHP